MLITTHKTDARTNEIRKGHNAYQVRCGLAALRARLGSASKAAAVLIMVLVMAIGSTPSFAQGTDAQRRAAIASAMEQAGGYGKVISVKPHTQADGSPGFRVRILTDGRVRTFDVPATAR